MAWLDRPDRNMHRIVRPSNRHVVHIVDKFAELFHRRFISEDLSRHYARLGDLPETVVEIV